MADDDTAHSLADGTTALLEAALEQWPVEDTAIAANETQAEASWSLRDRISNAERARGPAVQHDISASEKAMLDFIDEASAAL